jgi:hypothetical protein
MNNPWSWASLRPEARDLLYEALRNLRGAITAPRDPTLSVDELYILRRALERALDACLWALDAAGEARTER